MQYIAGIYNTILVTVIVVMYAIYSIIQCIRYYYHYNTHVLYRSLPLYTASCLKQQED